MGDTAAALLDQGFPGRVELACVSLAAEGFPTTGLTTPLAVRLAVEVTVDCGLGSLLDVHPCTLLVDREQSLHRCGAAPCTEEVINVCLLFCRELAGHGWGQRGRGHKRQLVETGLD